MVERYSTVGVVTDVHTFVFLKQKTAYWLRSSDWSSDVCSSDLHLLMVVKPISGSEVARRGANLSSFSCATFAVFRGFDARTGHAEIIRFAGAMRHAYRAPRGPFLVPQANQIGRAHV